MGRKWKALIIWIVVPYVFDGLLLPFIQSLFGERTSVADFWRATFHSGALIAVLVWCVAPAVIGTLVVWILPMSRFWIGVIAGVLVGIGCVVLMAWMEMIRHGGFEENIQIKLEAFNLFLPGSWAGAYAGFLRFMDQQTSRSKREEPPGAEEPIYFNGRHWVGAVTVFVVSTGIWVALLGRLRRWW